MDKEIILNGVALRLLAERAAYLPDEKILIISDWHLGKLRHFRAEGLFVPASDVDSELDRLEKLLEKLTVSHVVFLGDLFHSRWNPDWDRFKNYAQSLLSRKIRLTLTKGNHDILDARHFEGLDMQVREQIIISNRLVLAHDTVAGFPGHLAQIVGHLHPGCRVTLGARQSLRLPCFYLRSRTLTLPAFGQYTGIYQIKHRPGHRLFPVVNDCVLEMR